MQCRDFGTKKKKIEPKNNTIIVVKYKNEVANELKYDIIVIRERI